MRHTAVRVTCSYSSGAPTRTGAHAVGLRPSALGSTLSATCEWLKRAPTTTSRLRSAQGTLIGFDGRSVPQASERYGATRWELHADAHTASA